jgi:predicted XRE-type DNA-binding protein
MTVEHEIYPTVWHALFDDPVERLNLRMRSDLMIAIKRQVNIWGITQKDAAKRLGITQPRLNLLLKGKINEFSLDALIKVAATSGLDVHLEFKVAA